LLSKSIVTLRFMSGLAFYLTTAPVKHSFSLASSRILGYKIGTVKQECTSWMN
jgi:hypothetical protein